jgi:signal transduction histidine kinase
MFSRLAKIVSCDINVDNLPVRTEQILARLRSYPLMVGSQLLIAPLLVALMWDNVAHRQLLVWLGALVTALAVEVYFVTRYASMTHSLAECRVWRSRLIVFVCMVGVVWGAGGWLMFVPGDLAYQALLMCVFMGVAAGAATTNPVFPPALYIYISLLILPLPVINALEGDRTHLILAAMLLGYWAYILNSGRDLAATFELSLCRSFENKCLVGQLTEEKRHAEQASQMKSRFLAAASHDLRQPIHALSLFLEALRGHVNSKQGGELHSKVEQTAEVLSSMLDAMLDVSKLDAGVIQPNHHLFAMRPLLSRLHQEFSVLADAKGLQLEIEVGAELVFTDALLLERVLRNLLSNAIRYTEQGTVSIISQPVDNGVELTVCDTGIGIATEHLPHIFDEYFQVGNQQRDRAKGLGLGLAIVKRLNQLLELQLQVSANAGGGSRFVMQIPVQNLAA